VKYSRKMKLKKIIQNILHARLYENKNATIIQWEGRKEREREKEKERKLIGLE